MLKALSTVAALASLSGCLDAKKSFNDYENRIVDGNTSMPDRPAFTTIPNIAGHFFFGTRTVNVPENKIIELVGDFTFAANEDGTAKLSYTASALKLPEQTISAGVMDPDPMKDSRPPQVMSADMHVAIDGTFTVPLKGQLPGDANPIQKDFSVYVDGVMHGQIRTTDLICGGITGMAGPLSLDGSTFAAIRIPEGTIGAALPPVQYKCP